MGPRSNDRGKLAQTAKIPRWDELQWGRDHMIAESGDGKLFLSAFGALQWGRDHMIAERLP